VHSLRGAAAAHRTEASHHENDRYDTLLFDCTRLNSHGELGTGASLTAGLHQILNGLTQQETISTDPGGNILREKANHLLSVRKAGTCLIGQRALDDSTQVKRLRFGAYLVADQSKHLKQIRTHTE